MTLLSTVVTYCLLVGIHGLIGHMKTWLPNFILLAIIIGIAGQTAKADRAPIKKIMLNNCACIQLK